VSLGNLVRGSDGIWRDAFGSIINMTQKRASGQLDYSGVRGT